MYMHLVKLARILGNHQAEIAQLVEHTTENCGVVSSILTLGTPGQYGQTCGCSSIGRTSPCQGEGRGFESHRPLCAKVADC